MCGGSRQPSREREEEEDVSSDPRQSPGTAIKPEPSARNHVIAWTGHLIAISPFTINNLVYESIVPGRTFPCPPAAMKGRPYFHLIDWLCVCADGATVCLPCRWEPGSVSQDFVMRRVLGKQQRWTEYSAPVLEYLLLVKMYLLQAKVPQSMLLE